MKTVPKQSMSIRYLRGPIFGIVLFAALSLALACFTGNGTITLKLASLALYGVLVLSSLIAGALCGGAGKRGMMTGVILSICCLLVKAFLNSGSVFTVSSMVDLLCILPASWLGSCIFHKKRPVNTNRNRQIRRRNYK